MDNCCFHILKQSLPSPWVCHLVFFHRFVNLRNDPAVTLSILMVSDVFILQAGNKNLQQRLCKILNNNATGLHHDGGSQQKLYFWCLCVTYVYAICFSSVTVSIGNVPWVFVLVKSYLQRCFHTDSCLIRKVGQSIYYLNHINSLSTHKHRNKCTQYFPAL